MTTRKRGPWTLASIEMACRRVFTERGSATLAAMARNYAELWTEGGVLEARIDPLAVGLLPGVLHEMMHEVLKKEFLPFAEYGPGGKHEAGEIAMNAIEAAIARTVLTSRRRREWWRNAINAKLPRRQRVEA